MLLERLTLLKMSAFVKGHWVPDPEGVVGWEGYFILLNNTTGIVARMWW